MVHQPFQILALLLGAVLACPVLAETGLLYSTDFENFPQGKDQWAGHDGWITNPEATTGGIQGIDPIPPDGEERIPGLGNTAFLGGFATPKSDLTSVSRAFMHDPVEENSASIEILTSIALEDSTNGLYDSFFVSIYNNEGEFLAAIQFSNTRTAFGIYWDDGTQVFDADFNFDYGELAPLFIQIDLQNNRWSAYYLGLCLFTDTTFTSTGQSRTFGYLSYEWQTSSLDPTNHGSNWLLVAECDVWAIPPGLETPVVEGLDFTDLQTPSFKFLGEPGWNYQVEYTNSLNGWKTDLPNSFFPVTGEPKIINFTDTSPEIKDSRFYRIMRKVNPGGSQFSAGQTPVPLQKSQKEE